MLLSPGTPRLQTLRPHVRRHDVDCRVHDKRIATNKISGAICALAHPGTYNARRDNLEGFWKDLYGYRHGIMLATTFFDNVKRHRMEGRELRDGEQEENVVLQFTPGDGSDMLVACLWSRWKATGQPNLLSFTAITDDPPAEVLAAGHDRCIVPLKAENVDAWLNPAPRNLAAQYAILDDPERPVYEHQPAARRLTAASCDASRLPERRTS